MMIRIGHGYDVHKLIAERKLILGGVDIPFKKGLLGHSDADVLLHAVTDALLGAAALGDIGSVFPDNDEKYNGADSLKLLASVVKRLRDTGFSIVNIDSTIIAQEPKLITYITEMRLNIAGVCGVDIHSVSVKATTEEGLGFSGKGEGIAAYAVCLIENVDEH
jgi:2-C-methyl-D-erythritol 2,4-cyclodiphosphate synthase